LPLFTLSLQYPCQPGIAKMGFIKIGHSL
jgi:hypothetical protein